MNVCILEEIYNELEQYSEETGVPKTVVIEKTLQQYLNDLTEKK